MEGLRYVIVTNWAFPFGGGEAFMYQTMEWATAMGMKVFWVCFSKSDNKTFERFEAVPAISRDGSGKRIGTLLRVPGGLNEKAIQMWVTLLRADIVHHQGGFRLEVARACNQARVPLMTGFHFWHGAILLDSEHGNVCILDHAEKHRKDMVYEEVERLATCIYVASPFMVDVFQRVANVPMKRIIMPVPSEADCVVPFASPKTAPFVSMINVHKTKGGNIFLRLVRVMRHISFLAVITEHQSEELDNEIRQAMNDRKKDEAECTIIPWCHDVKEVYRMTKIMLVPSLCDETFCRVVCEAMANRIPVLTTGHGNISYLFGEEGRHLLLPATEPERWVEAVHRLTTDASYYEEWSGIMGKCHDRLSERRAIEQFRGVLDDVWTLWDEKRIMLYCPWCDQGLGVQSRNYAHQLAESGWTVFIFAYKPYFAKGPDDRHQRDPSEWEWPEDQIHYSAHDREAVRDTELTWFVHEKRIRKAIIPESCWFRIFEIATLLRGLNVQTFAVPNIEIVRRDEIAKHRAFHRILCNNRLCERIFREHGFRNVTFVGYSVGDDADGKEAHAPPVEKDAVVGFVCNGGMNGFTRKHFVEIAEGFALAAERVENIHLTMTVQSGGSKEHLAEWLEHPKMTIVDKHLPYSDIIKSIRDAHVSIQVSKHEGLGLGFYESFSLDTPVLTLDTPPHNELVRDGTNGWTIPCTHRPMEDNNNALFGSAFFDPKDLADKIVEIASQPEALTKMIASTRLDYRTRYHNVAFRSRFVSALTKRGDDAPDMDESVKAMENAKA